MGTEIAFFVYDGITALDAIGPYDVFRNMPGAEPVFVGERTGIVRDEMKACGIAVDATIDEITAPDVLIVPGGFGETAVRENERVLEWVRAVHSETEWTASVCTGALILGAAGILQGREATTHWLARDLLATFGAELGEDRVVFDGKVVTAAGVSAGIDLALELVERIEGDVIAQAVQLAIEYDPDPPFDSGSPETAPAVITELVRSQSRFAAKPAT